MYTWLRCYRGVAHCKLIAFDFFLKETRRVLLDPLMIIQRSSRNILSIYKITNIHTSHLGTNCVRKVKICNLLSKFYIYTTILYNIGRKSCISSVNSFILSIKQFQTQQSVISTLKSASPGIL